MYRKEIYKNYAKHNEEVSSFRSLNSEEKGYYKYFKKNYLRYIPKDKNCRILDLGCGRGNYIIAAQRCGYNNVFGVDGSQSCVDFCNERGLKCICADALDFLNNNRESFDVIIFNDIIEHFTKNEVIEVCIALREALVSGGCAIIKTDNMSNPFTAIGGRYLDLTHEFCYNEISLRQVLRAAGFSSITIKGTDIYVVLFPINLLAKLVEKVTNIIIFLFNCLYGRTSIKIFSKDILAIAVK